MAHVRIAGVMIALTGLLALTFLTSCHHDEAATPVVQTEPLEILSRFNGSDPAFKDPDVRVFNSRKELDAVDPPLARGLDVDFSTHTLIVLALGQKSTAGYWAYISGVEHHDAELFVQGVANAPAPGQAVGQAITYPYYAVVVPKIEPKTIHPEIESVVGKQMR